MNTQKNKTMTVPAILRFFGLTYLSCLTVFLFACNPTPKVADEVNSPLSTLDPPLIEPTGNAKLDSLLQIAATARPDTVLALIYADIGDIYYHNDSPKAKEYYLKLKTLSEELHWNKGRYLFAACFTDVLNREGLMDSAIVIHRQALEWAKEEKNELQTAKTLANIGNCYSHKKWLETALKYYHDALVLLEKSGDPFRIAHLYYLMGVVYHHMRMEDENRMYCEKALRILDENPDMLLRAHALVNSAVALQFENRLEEAEDYLLEAQRIYVLHNSRYDLINIYSNLGELAFRKYDLGKMEMYHRKLLELALEFGDIEGYCIASRALAYVEIYRGNFNQSEKYVMEALETAEAFDLGEEKLKCYDHLSTLSIARHDFRRHRFLEMKVDSIQTTIFSELTVVAAAEMAAKYETAKKELEIARQQEVIARQNMQRGLLVGGITVSAVILLLLWYMLNLRTRRNHALAERNDTLAEMNATKNKFFSIISHDLKNPAVAQRDAIQMLVKNGRLWDADTLTDYYHQLLESAEGEVELIFNLLGWAQIQTGRLTCVPDTFDISGVMPNLSLISGTCNHKGITLVTQIPKGMFITCDSNMISTVIRNLLTNAVKFTPAGGTVTLSVEHTGSPPRQKTRFTVSDTGIGMSRGQVQKLFCIDSAHSRPGTAGEQGTGLGLIVCREMLQKHGTALNMESVEGKGSSFWFEV